MLLGYFKGERGPTVSLEGYLSCGSMETPSCFRLLQVWIFTQFDSFQELKGDVVMRPLVFGRRYSLCYRRRSRVSLYLSACLFCEQSSWKNSKRILRKFWGNVDNEPRNRGWKYICPPNGWSLLADHWLGKVITSLISQGGCDTQNFRCVLWLPGEICLLFMSMEKQIKPSSVLCFREIKILQPFQTCIEDTDKPANENKAIVHISCVEVCSYVNNHPILCLTQVCCQGKNRGLFARRRNSLPQERRILVSLLSFQQDDYNFKFLVILWFEAGFAVSGHFWIYTVYESEEDRWIPSKL